MIEEDVRFRDRHDAGRRLAGQLAGLALDRPIIIALPRGGVPVAFEIATALRAPLDVVMVRKIGAPDNPEYGLGAVVDGAEPQLVINDEVQPLTPILQSHIEAEMKRQLQEIERRRRLYNGDRQPTPVTGRTIVLVDDGIATGGTVRAAITALRKASAGRIVLAVPVAPRDMLDGLREASDDFVCLAAPRNFRAVGLHYASFDQTSDDEVVALLEKARGPSSPARHDTAAAPRRS